MIGGIFGTIGKTLGIGQEKYFLELDDAAEQSVENLKGAATKVTNVAKEAASEIADKAQELVEETVDKAQELASEASDMAKEVSAKGKTAQKAAKTGKKAASQPVKTAATEESAAAVQPAAVRALDPEEIIRNAIAAGGKKTDSTGAVIETVSNFSTDFLLPMANSSRRRPGPSLNMFKAMVKK